MPNILSRNIKTLFPGYFAMVMATGIISIAAFQLGMALVAWVLFWLNAGFYAILGLAYLTRLLLYPKDMRADLSDTTRSPGFLTTVAGTCVFGSQFAILWQSPGWALGLWGVGILLWLVIIYAFFTDMFIRGNKSDLWEKIHGAWMLVIVSTQSIAVLGALVAKWSGPWIEEVLFTGLAMYLLGGFFYLLVIFLLVQRLLVYKLEAGDLTPTYWVNMGAAAITTLAGANLVLAAPQWDFLQSLLPLLRGLVAGSWAVTTWWIPLLFILGVWRHVSKRYPFVYIPQYWAMVFPLGMYTACTFQLARAEGLSFLAWIPHSFIFISYIAWIATFAGLLGSIWAQLRRPLAPAKSSRVSIDLSPHPPSQPSTLTGPSAGRRNSEGRGRSTPTGGRSGRG